MSGTINSVIEPQLTEANIPPERFKVLAIQLLANGCLMREEGGAEKGMYDDALRVAALLHDYFSVIGMTLHHDMSTEVFRLYPPGAEAPGVTMVDETAEGTASIRQRIPADTVAALLALRCLFEEKLQRGAIETSGEALVTLEDLSATMNTQLRRPLPTNATDKTALLNDLKRLRVIRLSSTFSVQDPDAFIGIRPHVTTYVSNSALENALASNEPQVDGDAESTEASEALAA